MSQTFTSPFTGNVIQPTDVSYYDLNFSANTQLFWPAVVNPTQVPAARIIDASATAPGLTIVLPQGNQGSVGSDILLVNRGANTFTVTNFGGVQSVSVAAGVAKYFWLDDNSTEAGDWRNITFGTGTSAADADSLAGYGLVALSGVLNTTQNVIVVTAPPTLNRASRAATYVWESGNGTFTLPAVGTIDDGWYIGFRNGGTGTLTIQGQSTSQINGLPSIETTPGDSGFIMFDAAVGDFFTVGYTIPANSTFTSAVYDVDSIIGNTFSLVANAPIIQSYVALSGSRTQNLAITLPSITQIYFVVNDTQNGTYNLTFQLAGSAQAPIIVSAGQVVTFLSDGNVLYVLNQTTTGVFFAVNGSATAPSYTFNNDNNTGMYLVGTSVLGFTANSTQMLQIDNSNLLSPQIRTQAQFTASLISGGQF
jgi:hypothetical protein